MILPLTQTAAAATIADVAESYIAQYIKNLLGRKAFA
jgi:hypothetical protein